MFESVKHGERVVLMRPLDFCATDIETSLRHAVYRGSAGSGGQGGSYVGMIPKIHLDDRRISPFILLL
jgi:hypothetical protein